LKKSIIVKLYIIMKVKLYIKKALLI